MLYNFYFQPKYAAKIHQNLRICKKYCNFAPDIKHGTPIAKRPIGGTPSYSPQGVQ